MEQLSSDKRKVIKTFVEVLGNVKSKLISFEGYVRDIAVHILIQPLREKSPNTEFFPVRIFRTEYGEYLSVFSPNTEKHGPEKTPYLNTFHAVNLTYRKNVFYEQQLKVH